MTNPKALAFVLFVVGCGGGTSGSKGGIIAGGDLAAAGDLASCTAGASGIAAPCAQPAQVDARGCSGGDLASYCRTSPCAGYADTLTSLGGSCDGNPSQHSVVRIGTCDDLRFIEVLGSGIGYKLLRFYDASGALVALEVGSDTTEYCSGTSFAETYGAVPCCTLVTTDVICAHPGITC